MDDLTRNLEALPVPDNDGPFLPILRLTLDNIDNHDAAVQLGQVIRERFPQAGPLLVLAPDVDITLLDDDDLSRIGLVRVRRVHEAYTQFLDTDDLDAFRDELTAMLSDTPETGVDG